MARRKPSPWGEGVTPKGVTDVGRNKFPGSPIKPTWSPPHPAPSGPPSPAGEGFSSVPEAFSSIFAAQMSAAGGRGMPRPYIHERQPLPPLIRHAIGVPLSRGMTATGSHEYSYSLRGAQPPGEGYFRFAVNSPPWPRRRWLRPGASWPGGPRHDCFRRRLLQ